jgi:hypothetical protein
MTAQSESMVDVTGNADDAKDETPVAAEKRSRRSHGKGFVYMGLPAAEEAIRKIDHHAKRMSKDGFARALGHDKAAGRFPNKLEALKLYKLVVEEGDDVVLTPLAADMLYGMSEAARMKARTTAFLSYEDFNRTFIECPKSQDHPAHYIVEYVKGKLGIVNEVERFKRLFIESAHFAGLLEGELNLDAKTLRFRNATVLPAGSDAPNGATPERKVGDSAYEVIAGQQAVDVLSSLGLSNYTDRAEVSGRTAGKVKLSFEDGAVTFEINRPQRIKIRNVDLVLDLPAMVKELRAKGFDA